jgi:cation diffusion facilitator CzcD-associated flavoprotein CzcO
MENRMTDAPNRQHDLNQDTAKPQPRMDRRAFFRGATLAVGGLSASTLLPLGPTRALAQDAPRVDTAEQLATQTQRSLRWAGADPANWVRTRAGVDHNVVIVGGGQSGLALAHGLRRKGVGRVEVIDQAEPGQAGIWRNIARMAQLRTPKTLPGPEQGNPSLGFRAWYETLNGPSAFDALERIPRLAWADYLNWFQQATGTNVRYRTRLLEIEPVDDLLRLQLESEGARRTVTTRKLILANGFAGAGGVNIPGFLRALPARVLTHTAQPFDFTTLAGKVVGVVGAGSSAFDAAATALEQGAKEVHLFSRRAYIDYPSVAPPSPARPAVDRGHANVLELAHELPDTVRWRNHLLRENRVASVPLDSIQRAVAFKNFYLHLNSPWSDVSVGRNGKVIAKVAGKTRRFDHVIAGTGYRIDLSAQPELARIHESIALWRDRFNPALGEEDGAAGQYPYLDAAFQFLPRAATGAEYLRNIHCFNLAATLSFGIPVGDVPSVVDQPRLIATIARDLYVEGVDLAAHQRYIQTPLTPPDPAPYRRAVQPG